MTAGLWIGVAAGVFMVIHMKNSLDEAVLYGEQEAQRYMQKSYAIRYLVVVVVFIAVSWLQIANVLTLFAGIMSLKLAAYLQPIMHSFSLNSKNLSKGGKARGEQLRNAGS